MAYCMVRGEVVFDCYDNSPVAYLCGHGEGFAQLDQSGEEETLAVCRPEEGKLFSHPLKEIVALPINTLS